MPVTLLEQESDKTKKAKPRVLDQEVVELLHRQTAIYLKFIETMGVDLRLGVLTLQTSYRSIAWLSPRSQSLWSVVTVDSSLSTPASRKWPVLFLPQNSSPPPVGNPTPASAAAKARPLEKGLAF